MAPFDQAWTRENYRALLRRFHGFYASWEPVLWQRSEWYAQGLQPQTRLKTPLLQRDLRFLGDELCDIKQLPRCEPFPFSSFAHALGCAYVLEGSTLGGQLLARHFGRELKLEATSGLAFFTAYGAQTGAMWNEFCAFLQGQAENHDATFNDEIVRSAQTTFSVLDAWLHLDKFQ